MNKTLILLAVFILLGGAATWLVWSKEDPKTSVVSGDRNFAIKDPTEIYKIFIADRNGQTTTLERKADYWVFNGQQKVRKNAIENLLDAITRIEMKYKPPMAAVNNMVKSLATEGLKVEIYSKENQLLKSYYIGGGTSDERGTYIMMSDAEQPYVGHLPGWEGNLRFRFNLNGDDWRDRTLFEIEVEDIQSVYLEYPKQRNKSFKLDRKNNDFELSPFYDITPVANKTVNPAQIEAYLSNFGRIVATGFHNDYEKKGGVLDKLPFCTLALTNVKGEEKVYRLFPIYSKEELDPKTGEVLAEANVLNYYVETQDGDLLTIQSRIINKVLWGYEFFFK